MTIEATDIEGSPEFLVQRSRSGLYRARIHRDDEMDFLHQEAPRRLDPSSPGRAEDAQDY